MRSAKHLNHSRQPQDRPISSPLERTKQNPIIHIQQQPGVGKAATVPYLCDLSEDNRHFRRTDEKEELSNNAKHIRTPFITPRDDSDASDPIPQTCTDKNSNSDGKGRYVSSSSFVPSKGYSYKTRPRTWSSSSSRSQPSPPSLVYSDCTDSQMSSRQNTPVAKATVDACFETPSSASQQQMYPVVHTTSPMCQYYFTPLQTMENTMMTPPLSHTLLLSRQHTHRHTSLNVITLLLIVNLLLMQHRLKMEWNRWYITSTNMRMVNKEILSNSRMATMYLHFRNLIVNK